MARILVVDDEPRIVEVVGAYLAREGHEVATAADGDAALAAARATSPDLVVLDVMLPGRSGFDVLRELRASGSSAAVVLLTARDDVIDRVAGLEIGADDYVTKPFEPRELVARVGAVLRRTTGGGGGAAVAGDGGPDRMDAAHVADGTDRSGEPPPAPSPDADGMNHAVDRGRPFFDLAIDRSGREVVRGAERIELTRVEFDLLDALADPPGIVLTREQLGERVFGERFDAFDRTMDSHVKNLRRKLGDRPDGGRYVETVRGVGYRAARP